MKLVKKADKRGGGWEIKSKLVCNNRFRIIIDILWEGYEPKSSVFVIFWNKCKTYKPVQCY